MQAQDRFINMYHFSDFVKPHRTNVPANGSTYRQLPSPYLVCLHFVADHNSRSCKKATARNGLLVYPQIVEQISDNQYYGWCFFYSTQNYGILRNRRPFIIFLKKAEKVHIFLITDYQTYFLGCIRFQKCFFEGCVQEHFSKSLSFLVVFTNEE